MLWVEVAPSRARSLRFSAKSWRVVSRVEDVAVGTFPASSWSSLFLSHTASVRNRLPWLSLLPLPALFLLHLSHFLGLQPPQLTLLPVSQAGGAVCDERIHSQGKRSHGFPTAPGYGGGAGARWRRARYQWVMGVGWGSAWEEGGEGGGCTPILSQQVAE